MTSRPGFAASAVAGFILLQLAAAGILLSADANGVRFHGAPIGGRCLFRQHTGVPCPACGMSRGVILTLHGDLGAALRANPAGPVWVGVALSVSIALLWLARRQRQEAGAKVARTLRRVRALALAEGIAFAVVLYGHWIRTLR